MPSRTNLHLISDDRDFASAFDETQLKDFLQDEWRKQKESTISYYRRISAFFKENFPNINLASETEKDRLVKELMVSPNFSTTHTIVAQLSRYTDFTASQAATILTSATANNQVGWIATDRDVKSLLEPLLHENKQKLDPDLVAYVETLLAPRSAFEQEEDHDAPF